jgi:hypothetical protein
MLWRNFQVISFSEVLVTILHITWHHSPEDKFSVTNMNISLNERKRLRGQE